MEVLRRCSLAIAQRLVHCAIALSTAVLDRVTKTMSVAPLLMNNLDNSKQKTSNLLSPAPPPYSWSLLGKSEGPAPPPSSKISWSFDLAWSPAASKMFSTCLKYSWFSVIWASGFVGIHMLKVLVVQCYLGQWLCWDSHAETRVEPHPRLYWAFENHPPQQTIYLKYESTYVFAKNRESKRLKNWFSSLTSPALFTEAIFCVTFYISAHQLHTTPHSSHIIIICEIPPPPPPFFFFFKYFFSFLFHLEMKRIISSFFFCLFG